MPPKEEPADDSGNMAGNENGAATNGDWNAGTTDTGSGGNEWQKETAGGANSLW